MGSILEAKAGRKRDERCYANYEEVVRHGGHQQGKKTIDLITKMYVSPSRVLTYVAFYLLLAPEG